VDERHWRNRALCLLGAAVSAIILLGFGCGSSKEPGASREVEELQEKERQEEAQKGPQVLVEEVQEEEYRQVSAVDVVLRWKVEGSRLSVILEAPTAGWVAVGFDPANGMEDANFIIGYVEGSEVMVRDDYGTGLSAHDSDEKLGGTSDIESISGEESEGNTQIAFSIPLDSGDRYDRALEKGREYTVLLAYGKSDGFTSVHSKRAKATIAL
jgi:hypothetical protein